MLHKQHKQVPNITLKTVTTATPVIKYNTSSVEYNRTYACTANGRMMQENDGIRGRYIVCSFHRDYLPNMQMLQSYFGKFGEISEMLKMDYDPKQVPICFVLFDSEKPVVSVMNEGHSQNLKAQNMDEKDVHFRVFNSWMEYNNNHQDRYYERGRYGGRGHHNNMHKRNNYRSNGRN